MSNGFGAGFFALALLGVLAALAVGLAALGVAMIALRRYRDRSPAALGYLAVLLLVAVLVVTGFGVLAMVDEASLVVVLFTVLVALPLGLAGGHAYRRGGGVLDVAVAAAVAWSGPYVAALAVLVGLFVGGATFAVATTLAGVVAVGGTLVLGTALDGELDAVSA